MDMDNKIRAFSPAKRSSSLSSSNLAGSSSMVCCIEKYTEPHDMTIKMYNYSPEKSISGVSCVR